MPRSARGRPPRHCIALSATRELPRDPGHLTGRPTALVAGRPRALASRESTYRRLPLFCPAAIGELSVRWNAVLNRWVCMYMPGPEDPIGLAVVLRIARQPWGPWSRRRLVLDWRLDGLGHRPGQNGERLQDGWFIHDGDAPPSETRGDDIIGNRAGKGGGGPYAPYQLPLHTRRTRHGTSLYEPVPGGAAAPRDHGARGEGARSDPRASRPRGDDPPETSPRATGRQPIVPRTIDPRLA